MDVTTHVYVIPWPGAPKDTLKSGCVITLESKFRKLKKQKYKNKKTKQKLTYLHFIK